MMDTFHALQIPVLATEWVKPYLKNLYLPTKNHYRLGHNLVDITAIWDANDNCKTLHYTYFKVDKKNEILLHDELNNQKNLVNAYLTITSHAVILEIFYNYYYELVTNLNYVGVSQKDLKILDFELEWDIYQKKWFVVCPIIQKGDKNGKY